VPEVLNRANQIVECSTDDPRVKRIIKTMETYKKKPDALIQVFHYVQDVYGYLPLGVVNFICKEMMVPPSRAFGVATFYNYFSLKPKGEHTCLVCTGTACYVKGAQKIVDEIEKTFSIKPGETTPDNKLGLQVARCIGSCGLAPAVVLDNEILAKVDPVDITQDIKVRIGDGR
jgi:bidirectional [NiFe] hydrogenase diaphorase subunit